MTVLSFLLVALSELCSLAGQFFFKIAMDSKWANTQRRSALALTGGVVVMAVGFFVWLGLLAKYDLSFLYPFDGTSRIFLLVGAAVFLKEKVTARLWVGVTLITAGVALVATS